MQPFLIQLDAVTFAWPGQSSLLDIQSFALYRGERVFLKGPSGSGKTTLLGLLGGVLLPDSGSIKLLEKSLADLSAARRDQFRADHTGYIFQMFNLLPYLSLVENVTLPCRFSAVRRARALAECERGGSSLLFVSHDSSLEPLFDRALSLKDINRAATTAEVL